MTIDEISKKILDIRATQMYRGVLTFCVHILEI